MAASGRGDREWPGTAVISMEYLAPRTRQKIDVVVESFGPTVTSVVLTARGLGRTVPSAWTESMQNRGALSWREYLAAVRSVDEGDRDEHPAAIVAARRGFWRHQHLAGIARRWSEAVGPEHFTLITVPPPASPPDVLWSRFAQVLGVPARREFRLVLRGASARLSSRHPPVTQRHHDPPTSELERAVGGRRSVRA